MPHVHLSGLHGAAVFLFVVAAFGSLHMLASSFPNAVLSQAWFRLGF